MILAIWIPSGFGAQFPVGTVLHIRLKNPIGSTLSKAGDPVASILIEPLSAGDQILLPSLTQVHGSVKEARAASGDQSAVLALDFTQLQSQSGFHAKISAKVKDVDDARETVDSVGRIQGIVASKTLTAEADKGISKLSQNYSGLGDLLAAAKSAIVKPADPEIKYPAGVELTLELTQPFSLANAVPGILPPLVPFDSERGLTDMVSHQPMRAFAANPPRPSDLTNLLVVGTENQLVTAFQNAGWSAAASLDGRSKLETMRAIMENRGYQEGPVSLLTVDGLPPDLVFEKANNTFAARHHLRVWRRRGTYDGLPIWLITATHDIGIAYSEDDRTFIHKIDSHIDAERSKVVNDLLDTGMVRSLALIERRQLPPNATNATGDSLITDGKMAVVMLGGSGEGITR